MDKQADLAASAVTRLSARVAAKALSMSNEAPTMEELRAHVKGAQQNLRDVRQAIAARDAERLQAALQSLRKSFEPVREAAKRPAQ